jgi:ubiquinone/menaquinone biosynthesis C-methylase UbiE
MAIAIPERILWAVGQIGIKGTESILEIGCGRGVAAGLVAQKLTTGRLVAIDRSETAIKAARERNAEHESSRLTFVATDIATYDGAMNSFDVVFAINVNVFWLDPSDELPVIPRVLKPKGRLWLFYEPPSLAQISKIEDRLRSELAAYDFEIEQVLKAKAAKSSLLAVAARTPTR